MAPCSVHDHPGRAAFFQRPPEQIAGAARSAHVPERRCVGCGARAPRAQLRRFATVDGRVVPDLAAALPGRGAWLHESPTCWEAALRKRAFARAFRAPVTIPEETVDFISRWQRSAFTS